MEQLVSNEITKLVVYSPEDILQFAYENTRTGAGSVVNNVVEQNHFGLLHAKVMEEILKEQITKYFVASDTSYKVHKKPPSTNAFMVQSLRSYNEGQAKPLLQNTSPRRWKEG